MKKQPTSYLYVTTLTIFVLTLLFLFLASYLIVLLPNQGTTLYVLIIALALLFSVTVTVGILAFNPTWDKFLSTSRQLYRFESLSHPLLLRLSTEAPGTYHHSINVSNLAHRAAKSIGADALLIRTGGYYHDIGKLLDPLLFIENQALKEIPTEIDDNSIKRMAQKIISHVEYGLKIAKENHLPEEITDLIAQHHGTSFALYFYERAKERKLNIKKTDFRYIGPVPLSREAAIIMIADTIEATTRARTDLTPEAIKSIVQSSISDKIADGQLGKSQLSEDDLARISESFEATLLAIYHQRLDYRNNNESLTD